MDIKEKLLVNKKIKKYEGSNTFISSLKTSLQSKYCRKEELNGKNYKVLSDKQYEIALSILEDFI